MKTYSVRNASTNAIKYFSTIEKALAYLSRDGRCELTGEVSECTEERIGTEYEWKVIIKHEAPASDSIAAFFGEPEDEVYMVSGHDIL